MSDLQSINVPAAQASAVKLAGRLIEQQGIVSTLGITFAMAKILIQMVMHAQTPFFETNIITLNTCCRELLAFIKQHEECARVANGQHGEIPKGKMA